MQINVKKKKKNFSIVIRHSPIGKKMTRKFKLYYILSFSLQQLAPCNSSNFRFCETLVHAIRIEEIKSLGFNSCFVVDVNGRGVGLALLWKDPFECHLLNCSSNFINIQVHQSGHPVWRALKTQKEALSKSSVHPSTRHFLPQVYLW